MIFGNTYSTDPVVNINYRFFFLVFFLFVVFSASSQDYIFDPDKKTKTDREVYNEGSQKTSKLLLISYHPDMHLPDPAGDVELVMRSGKSMTEMYRHFRTALDMSLSSAFKDGFQVYSLLRSPDLESERDMDRVYNSISYKYEKRPIDESEKKPIDKVQDYIEKAIIDPKEEETGEIKEGQLSNNTPNREEEYMNVLVRDSTLVPYLINKYESDLLVFINQIEVKKTFASGSDVPYSIYGRVVKVHYTVINKEGERVYGNVAVSGMLEKSDYPNEIIKSTYPAISQDIYKHLPGSGNSNEMLELEKKYEKKAEKQDILRKN